MFISVTDHFLKKKSLKENQHTPTQIIQSLKQTWSLEVHHERTNRVTVEFDNLYTDGLTYSFGDL